MTDYTTWTTEALWARAQELFSATADQPELIAERRAILNEITTRPRHRVRARRRSS